MSTNRPRVLVIDDNDDERSMLRAALSPQYDVRDAADGLDGYAIACRECPAAILLDIAMPIVDGWSVLRKLRTNADTKHVPIVIFTALEREAVAAQARTFGVDSIVRKPAPLDEVVRALQRAIRA